MCAVVRPEDDRGRGRDLYPTLRQIVEWLRDDDVRLVTQLLHVLVVRTEGPDVTPAIRSKEPITSSSNPNLSAR